MSSSRARARYIKLKKDQLIVGDKAPFHVYTRRGVLLLSRGMPIENDFQVASLEMQGYLDPDEKVIQRQDATEVQGIRYTKDVNPFLELDSFYQALYGIHQDLMEQKRPQGLSFEIRNIAIRLPLLALRKPAALLGAAHWPHHEPSMSLGQALRSAVLIAVVAQQQLRLPAPQLQATLCAALTANLSLTKMQDELYQLPRPLSEVQRRRMQSHPQKTAQLLELLGVEDELWLEAVRQHHERLDGSGYPQGLQGKAIGLGARLIGLADTYMAMTSPRQYRTPLSPRQAMRELLGGENQQLDARLGKAFLRSLGVFPPGSVVALDNGDTAVVIEPGASLNQPICAAIKAASGDFYLQPLRRDTSDFQYRIIKVLGQEILHKRQPFLFWNTHPSQRM